MGPKSSARSPGRSGGVPSTSAIRPATRSSSWRAKSGMSSSRPKRRLTRRTLRSTSSVEQYLQAGVVPRFIERALQIEDGTRRHRQRLERAYEWTREKYAGDPVGFAERWTELARTWRFEDVNELIDEHNRWYPA